MCWIVEFMLAWKRRDRQEACFLKLRRELGTLKLAKTICQSLCKWTVEILGKLASHGRPWFIQPLWRCFQLSFAGIQTEPGAGATGATQTELNEASETINQGLKDKHDQVCSLTLSNICLRVQFFCHCIFSAHFWEKDQSGQSEAFCRRLLNPGKANFCTVVLLSVSFPAQVTVYLSVCFEKHHLQTTNITAIVSF